MRRSTHLRPRRGDGCLIDPQAREACETIVELEAQEKSLRELAEMVAREADLVIKWTDDQVIVSKAE